MDHTLTPTSSLYRHSDRTNRFPSIRKKSFRRSFSHNSNSMDTSLSSAGSLMRLGGALTLTRPDTLEVPTLKNHRKYSHRRAKSFETSTPDLTSLKLYSPEKKKSFDLLLDYDYTGAVFEAVRRCDLNELELILEMRDVTINSVNTDGMSALDMALLLQCESISNYLLKHGATLSLLADMADTISVTATLSHLISAAEQKEATLCGKITASSSKLKEHQRKLELWTRKRKMLKRMEKTYKATHPPHPVQNIELIITSQKSLRVEFDALEEEEQNGERSRAVIIAYKVEWSRCPLFSQLEEEILPALTPRLQYEITGLQSLVPYYIRVSACNMKGFGEKTTTEPQYAIPSSWRDCSTTAVSDRVYDTESVQDIYNEIKAFRSMDDNSSSSSSESPSLQQNLIKSKRSRLKGLFASTPPTVKLSKSVKRGIYLACVFYYEDRLLVTEEDRYFPMVEVEETYSTSTITRDFNWLLKVCSHWQDIRQLKADLERLTGVTSYSLRSQLLNAAIQLQTLLGVHDLGMLHYRPIKDPETGALVLSLVQKVSQPKSLNGFQNLKWSSLAKIQKNKSSQHDCIIPVLEEMMLYRQGCHLSLTSGLYMGYLQTEVSYGSIKVQVSELKPNSLPCIKIRDNPNISENEWQSLLELQSEGEDIKRGCAGTDIVFQRVVLRAARKLMDQMNIPTGLMVEHRIYHHEILELSPNISMLVLLPPQSQICRPLYTNTEETYQSRAKTSSHDKQELLSVPVKQFEISHMHTYHKRFISAYTKAMLLIDMEVTSAQQANREAFADEEIESTKQHLQEMSDYKDSLDNMWRQARWMTDLITLAREKSYSGIPMRNLYHAVLSNNKATHRQTSTCSDPEDNSDSGYHSNRQSLAESNSPDTKRAPDSQVAPAARDSLSLCKTHRNVYRLSLNDRVMHKHHLRHSTASSCESLDSASSDNENSILLSVTGI